MTTTPLKLSDKLGLALAILAAWAFWAFARYSDWIDTPWWQIAVLPALAFGWGVVAFLPAVVAGVVERVCEGRKGKR